MCAPETAQEVLELTGLALQHRLGQHCATNASKLAVGIQLAGSSAHHADMYAVTAQGNYDEALVRCSQPDTWHHLQSTIGEATMMALFASTDLPQTQVAAINEFHRVANALVDQLDVSVRLKPGKREQAEPGSSVEPCARWRLTLKGFLFRVFIAANQTIHATSRGWRGRPLHLCGPAQGSRLGATGKL